MDSGPEIALLILNQVTRNATQKIRPITNQLLLHGLLECIGYGADECGMLAPEALDDHVHKLVQGVSHVGDVGAGGVIVVVLHGHTGSLLDLRL